MLLSGGGVVFIRCELYGSVVERGGAVEMTSAGGSVTFEESVVRDNVALVEGGVGYAPTGAFVVRRSSVYNNTAGWGGAFWVNNGFLRLEESDLVDNRAEFEGGECVC